MYIKCILVVTGALFITPYTNNWNIGHIRVRNNYILSSFPNSEFSSNFINNWSIYWILDTADKYFFELAWYFSQFLWAQNLQVFVTFLRNSRKAFTVNSWKSREQWYLNNKKHSRMYIGREPGENVRIDLS